jgi:hypothetical protein
MRLRSSATALSRAEHRNRAVLDQLRKTVSDKPAPEPADPELPASIETPDLIAFARSVMQTRRPAIAARLSRQQRRAAKRQAEKAGLREQTETRQTKRTATHGPDGSSLA